MALFRLWRCGGILHGAPLIRMRSAGQPLHFDARFAENAQNDTRIHIDRNRDRCAPSGAFFASSSLAGRYIHGRKR